VILRGKTMVENGELMGDGNDGQMVLRKVDQSVLQRPTA